MTGRRSGSLFNLSKIVPFMIIIVEQTISGTILPKKDTENVAGSVKGICSMPARDMNNATQRTAIRNLELKLS
jgi:hypothetical protein